LCGLATTTAQLLRDSHSRIRLFLYTQLELALIAYGVYVVQTLKVSHHHIRLFCVHYLPEPHIQLRHIDQ
jgi:hypothetical protein